MLQRLEDILVIIKHGATRIVFIFNKFVIKIPNIKEYKLFLNGILANLQEKIFSGTHPDLCPVIFCDRLGLILIMEKAIIFKETAINEKSFCALIKNKYKKDNYKEFMLSDLKSSNWGILNTKLVKIDYGN